MTVEQAGQWLDEFNRLLSDSPLAEVNLRIVLCPSTTALYVVNEHIKRLSPLKDMAEKGLFAIGSQKISPSGQHNRTGEIGPDLLLNVGVQYVIIGHSEQREFMGETDQLIAERMQIACSHGLIPILCVGETADEYDAGETEKVLTRQLEVLRKCTDDQRKTIIIAYEPVWAIGTGRTPTPEDANKTIRFIKDKSSIPVVIYGGSVNDENAADFFSQPDIDGGLPGGASLNPNTFYRIVESASHLL